MASGSHTSSSHYRALTVNNPDGSETRWELDLKQATAAIITVFGREPDSTPKKVVMDMIVGRIYRDAGDFVLENLYLEIVSVDINNRIYQGDGLSHVLDGPLTSNVVSKLPKSLENSAMFRFSELSVKNPETDLGDWTFDVIIKFHYPPGYLDGCPQQERPVGPFYVNIR